MNENEDEDEDYDEHGEINITNKKTNEELSVQKKEYMDGRTIEIKRGAKKKKIETESSWIECHTSRFWLL